MNLHVAADVIIENDSRKLSHCFGLALPITYNNGKIGEKVLNFAKSKTLEQLEAEREAIETKDTLWIEGIEDCKAGSPERIELLRKYYEVEEQSANPRSASVSNDMEFADDLIQAVLDFPQTAKVTPIVEWVRSEIRSAYLGE